MTLELGIFMLMTIIYIIIVIKLITLKPSTTCCHDNMGTFVSFEWCMHELMIKTSLSTKIISSQDKMKTLMFLVHT